MRERRYQEKVNEFCQGILIHRSMPNIRFRQALISFDICKYCNLKDSAYTHQSLKAFNSLEAYKMSENGWLQSLNCKNFTTGSSVVMSKVSKNSIHILNDRTVDKTVSLIYYLGQTFTTFSAETATMLDFT